MSNRSLDGTVSVRVGVQPSFIVRTNLSAYAFKFGDRGGNLTDWMPASASVLRNSFVYSGSRSWIRKRFPVKNPSTASVKFRAIWLIHSPLALLAIPPICSCRVDRSMKNKMTKRFKPEQVHLDCEEISGDNLLPMSPQEFLPRCSSIPFRSGLDAVPLQDIGDGVACQNVPHIRERTLDSSITPTSVFLGHTKNECSNFLRGSRSAWCS